MVTIVKQITTNKNFILIGTGFAAYKTSKPSTFTANRVPTVDQGEFPMVAVCDENGTISWMKTDEIKIIEIDEALPLKILEDR